MHAALYSQYWKVHLLKLCMIYVKDARYTAPMLPFFSLLCLFLCAHTPSHLYDVPIIVMIIIILIRFTYVHFNSLPHFLLVPTRKTSDVFWSWWVIIGSLKTSSSGEYYCESFCFLFLFSFLKFGSHPLIIAGFLL